MADLQSYSDIVLSDGTTSWPFTYAITDQQPYLRQTNDFRRQQIDTSPEPGEQTLSQWWVRSEDSWHRGAGIQNYEPGSNHETQYRFSSGVGVNPWVSGSMTNSPTLASDVTGTGTFQVNTATYAGTTYAYRVHNTGVMSRYIPQSGSATAYSAPSNVGTCPQFAGSTVIVGGDSTGTIMSGSATGSALTNLWTAGPASTTVTPYWVKNRIIATAGDKLWELTLAGGAFPGTPTFTAPSTGGTWTAVAEAPDCILASYNTAGRGYVYAIRLVESTTAGSSPTLGAVVQVAQMPPGEEIFDMKTYLGSFVAFGTTYGVRVGELGTNGSMTYGPLTIDTTPVAAGAAPLPCYSLGSRGRFVLAGVNDPTTGLATLARIDLSQEILNYTNTGYASKTLRYAYNYDVSLSSTTSANTVICIAPLQLVDGVICAITGKGVYYQQYNSFQTGGYFYTGRIRYGTTEPKSYCYVRLNATVPANTSIEIYIKDPTGAETLATTVTVSTDLTQDILLPTTVRNNTYPWVEVKFVLKSTNSAITPLIDSVSLKANPLPRLQRLLQIPLRLVDWEMDRNGVKIGYDGSAWARLQALEALEQRQSLITVTDNTNGETFTGIIQKVQFLRDTPPSRAATNFGGVVQVVVLKV